MRLPGFEDVFVAHGTDPEAGTGCTVVVAPQGAVGAVDVAGGAPATRETDLLRPDETVDRVHAVVLSGGSAYGLAASTGVMEELERRDIGLDLGVCRVPIVCGACLFDLAVGDPATRPDAAMGARTAARALDGDEARPLAQGNVGAGTGCTVGKFLGPDLAMKGGLGWATAQVGDLVVTAVAAVNAVGSVVDPATGQVVAGAREASDSDVAVPDPLAALAAGARMPLSAIRSNTTLSCVVTNARLAKAEATRAAKMCSDGYARSIVPSHTTNDGDAVFVLATGVVEAPVDLVGVVGQRAVAEAVASGCRAARNAYGYPGAAGGDAFEGDVDAMEELS